MIVTTPIRNIIISRAIFNGIYEKIPVDVLNIKSSIGELIKEFSNNYTNNSADIILYISLGIIFYYSIQKIKINNKKFSNIELYSKTKKIINIIILFIVMFENDIQHVL